MNAFFITNEVHFTFVLVSHDEVLLCTAQRRAVPCRVITLIILKKYILPPIVRLILDAFERICGFFQSLRQLGFGKYLPA